MPGPRPPEKVFSFPDALRSLSTPLPLRVRFEGVTSRLANCVMQDLASEICRDETLNPENGQLNPANAHRLHWLGNGSVDLDLTTDPVKLSLILNRMVSQRKGYYWLEPIDAKGVLVIDHQHAPFAHEFGGLRIT